MISKNNRQSVVPNILRQHVEDAAYIWSHRSSNLWSPFFLGEHIQQMDCTLDANLEGLRIAGSDAIPIAFKSLSRWQTPEEAFVATYIVTNSRENDSLERLEKQLTDRPTLSSGAAAALLWSDPKVIRKFVDRWLFSEHDSLRQAAIPAALIHPELDMNKFIRRSIDDPAPGVRVRVYRTVGEWRLSDFQQELHEAFAQKNILCMAEAAVSLALMGDLSALKHIPKVFPFLKSAHLQRYLLIWSSLSTHEDFEAWFQQHKGEKDQYRNLIWALIFRGDPVFLPRLKRFILSEIEPVLASYAVCHITGLNMEKECLCVDPSKNHIEDELEKHINDFHPDDAGLPIPEIPAMVDWIDKHESRFNPDTCYVAGRPLASIVQDIYIRGTQPQRWQAALKLTLNGESGKMPALLQPSL